MSSICCKKQSHPYSWLSLTNASKIFENWIIYSLCTTRVWATKSCSAGIYQIHSSALPVVFFVTSWNIWLFTALSDVCFTFKQRELFLAVFSDETYHKLRNAYSKNLYEWQIQEFTLQQLQQLSFTAVVCWQKWGQQKLWSLRYARAYPEIRLWDITFRMTD